MRFHYRNVIRPVVGLCAAAAALFYTLPAAADSVTFNYQGRVRVGGQPFTGTGQFKFAVVNTSGTTTLWSNDGTLTGTPAASVSVPVSDGVFSVEIGGTGMSPLDQGIFVTASPHRLRTWFSDGSGFEQLTPDHKLTDLTLNTVQTGNSDYTIYVDGTNGNDANNGLSLATAKKTVTGAVDIIPARVRCNLTVKIQPGTYREQVGVSNIAVAAGKTLLFLGDESWTSTSLGIPSVRISAASGETPQTRGAGDSAAFSITHCARVTLKGIQFDGGRFGLSAENSTLEVKSCRATNCALGMLFAFGTFAKVHDCVSSGNDTYPATGGGYGYHIGNSATGWFYGIVAKNNGFGGIRVNHHSTLFMFGKCELTDNTVGGINAYSYGEIQLDGNGTYTMGRHQHYNVSLTDQSMLAGVSVISPVGSTPISGSVSKDVSSYTK